MHQWTCASRRRKQKAGGAVPGPGKRLLTDGGHEGDEDEIGNSGDHDETEVEEGETSSKSRTNVNITEAGEAEPVEPKWQKPDIESVEDIPEVTGPKTRPADSNQTDHPADMKDVERSSSGANGADVANGQAPDPESTAGMPNTARSSSQSRLKKGGADGYVVALELCARLPEDMRLPDEAADLVPIAFEAELEQNVQQFASEQFDNPSPHVETLDFTEVDDELWLRLRLGVPPEAFADLDPDEIREHALQKLDGMF